MTLMDTKLETRGSVATSYASNSFDSSMATFTHPTAEVHSPKHDVPPSANKMLSRRQQEVLILIIQGCSNKEIARALNLALGTVKIHVTALFVKLGVRRRAALAVAGARFHSRVP